jgi:DNA-binding transcriptional LysR family regulator
MANTEHLAIPAEVSEGEFIRADDPQKALFTATMLNVGPSLRIRKLLAVKTIAPYIVQECDGGPSLLTAVDMGLGVAILHDVARLTASPRLKFVPIKPQPQPIEIGILHAQDGDLTPAGEKLIQILRKVAKQSSDELSS